MPCDKKGRTVPFCSENIYSSSQRRVRWTRCWPEAMLLPQSEAGTAGNVKEAGKWNEMNAITRCMCAGKGIMIMMLMMIPVLISPPRPLPSYMSLASDCSAGGTHSIRHPLSHQTDAGMTRILGNEGRSRRQVMRQTRGRLTCSVSTGDDGIGGQSTASFIMSGDV